ncbi:MAG: hypothetical protein K0V04_38980 [Deltaproteobacteria bacterium]|nr:hypothetical protein [Deltaproteobacteria bacterium]
MHAVVGWWRTTLLASGIAAALQGGCSLTFPCESDGQCARGDASGTCEASGFCSFPDPSCESDQRYGELAPDGLAGACVPATGTTTVEGSTTAGTASSTSAPPPTTSIDPDTSGGSTGADDTSDTDGGSSSGGLPVCCDAECDDACGANFPCAPVVVGGPSTAEAIDVVVIGDMVVWSTGDGTALRLSGFDPGTDELLADISPHGNVFVTRIAADDTHVYFLDFNGPVVGRVSVPDGAYQQVTSVAGGGAAHFGGLEVSAEHVYFAMFGTGGIYRGAKDLSDMAAAELVADANDPQDVATDDTHVYWSESNMVRRLAFADIGTQTQPTTLDTGLIVNALDVDETHVFMGGAGEIRRVGKDGNSPAILTNATAAAWDIAVDDVHVYWTSNASNEVFRMRKDGAGAPEVIATGTQPWGMDTSCNAVFWTQNLDYTVNRVAK